MPPPAYTWCGWWPGARSPPVAGQWSVSYSDQSLGRSFRRLGDLHVRVLLFGIKKERIGVWGNPGRTQIRRGRPGAVRGKEANNCIGRKPAFLWVQVRQQSSLTLNRVLSLRLTVLILRLLCFLVSLASRSLAHRGASTPGTLEILSTPRNPAPFSRQPRCSLSATAPDKHPASLFGVCLSREFHVSRIHGVSTGPGPSH